MSNPTATSVAAPATDTPLSQTPAAAPATPVAATAATAATATQDAPQSATTLLDAPVAAPAGKSDWPDNWRELYAGKDVETLKKLGGFASPKAALDALLASQDKVSSGQLKKPLGANATAEELAAYRADNGIPETPDKYDLKLSNGRVVGDTDKPLVEKFIASMHGKNATPDQVNAGVDAYYDIVDEMRAQQHEKDLAFQRASLDELRAEFGDGYRRNLNMINGLLAEAPPGVKDMLMGARTADGTRIINSPNVLRWLAQTAHEINPVATVVPGAGANAGQAIGDEMASIQKLMGDSNSEYWKGPKSETMQARFRELASAKERIK